MNLRSFGYPEAGMLLACPFCREMFEEGEAKACPVCGMALTQFDKLPPSLDAIHDEGGVPLAPELVERHDRLTCTCPPHEQQVLNQ